MRCSMLLLVGASLSLGCSPTDAEAPSAAPPPVDTGDTGDAVGPRGLMRTVLPGVLQSIVRERRICFLGVGRGGAPSIDVLGLDSSTIAPLPIGPMAGTIDAVYAMFMDHGLLILSGPTQNGSVLVGVNPRTGAVMRTSALGGEIVHRMGSRYLTEGAGATEAFSTLSGAVAGHGAVVNLPVFVSQVGNGANLLPGSWHSDDSVDLIDPVTFAIQRTVVLQGFDTWVTDMQEAGRRLYMLDDGRSPWAPSWTQVVSEHDSFTGAFEDAWALPRRVGNYQSFFCTPTP